MSSFPLVRGDWNVEVTKYRVLRACYYVCDSLLHCLRNSKNMYLVSYEL